jgi:hypothetical protein
MKEKYLLYIDVLGFSELVKSEQRTRELYEIIDSLNVHNHDVFQTIVFSDTILVYNKKPPFDQEAAEYIVWYATEFAEDLHFRLIGKDLYFRAMLTFGPFDHYHLKHTECFFGQALINAYQSEKHAPITGLLIDKECHRLLRFFESERFDENWHFVYLERTFESLLDMSYGRLPVDRDIYCEGESVPYLLWALKYIQNIYLQMRKHPSPLVRTKFLATWDFYQRRYGFILDALVTSNFSPEPLCPSFNWTPLVTKFCDEFKNC